MTTLDLSIPVYAGGYNQAADALQAEMVEVRDRLLLRHLSEDERRAISQQADQAWRDAFDRGQQMSGPEHRALVARLEGEALARHVTDGDEDLVLFSQLRQKMADEYGVVA